MKNGLTQKQMIEKIFDAIFEKKGLLVRVSNLEMYWKITLGILVILIIPLVLSCVR